MSGRSLAKRLTPDQRDAMLADYLAGIKLAAIAAQYGVHESYPGHYARKFGHPPRRPWCATLDRNYRSYGPAQTT